MAIHDISGRAGAPLYRKPGQGDVRRVAVILAIYAAVVLAAVQFANVTSAPLVTGTEDWRGNSASPATLH